MTEASHCRPRPASDSSKPSLREIAERARRGALRPMTTLAPVRDNEDTGYVEVAELRNLMLARSRATDDEEATRAYVPLTPLAYARSEPPRTVARRALSRRAAAAAFAAGLALVGIVAGAFWLARARPARSVAAPSIAVAVVTPPAAPETAPSAPARMEPKPGETSVQNLPDFGAPPTAAPVEEASPAPGIPGRAAPAQPVAAKPGKPSDLASAIAAAAADTKPPAPEPTPAAPEPATPAPATANASGTPQQPSQAAVRAALNAVKGAAKACVAEADAPSRAQVVFAPSGAVTSVGVSGWAAANGASGCIKSALKPAHVDAFSGPSFSVGVTINP